MASTITQAEQNLQLLQAMIPANEQFYVWCFTREGRCLGTSCPEEDRPLLERAFLRFGGWERALGAAEAGEPRLIGSPIGMQWAVTFETERRGSLVFVAGPVFYTLPTESQLRSTLRSYTDDAADARWAVALLRRLPFLPVMPYAIFSRYVMMVHNALTGSRLELSALQQTAAPGHADPIPQGRDRTKVYQAERAMLQMVRNGDINYQHALDLSSSLSPGVPVQGEDPLQQNRISIIVFTSLVCRAAIEGGLSPEVAYPLGDAYIASAVRSRDTGELSALAQTMYHDFIYRVHNLRVNPDYSPAVQKCCAYVELSLDKKIRLADLAALTGYTEYYLTDKFKKETGIPLYLYIRFAKIEKAKVLLESTDLSVREIAERLAFSSQNFFIKCFHEVTGYSPAKYRKAFALGR
ncbi:MAG: helix-turn-helix domain-containing protein [Oscillospiraceae bacterium]|nr:helix-turn-helix domain-containing protein [Oscillospiraceae bacterium]